MLICRERLQRQARTSSKLLRRGQASHLRYLQVAVPPPILMHLLQFGQVSGGQGRQARHTHHSLLQGAGKAAVVWCGVVWCGVPLLWHAGLWTAGLALESAHHRPPSARIWMLGGAVPPRRGTKQLQVLRWLQFTPAAAHAPPCHSLLPSGLFPSCSWSRLPRQRPRIRAWATSAHERRSTFPWGELAAAAASTCALLCTTSCRMTSCHSVWAQRVRYLCR